MADLKTETITGGRPGSGAHRVVALCGPYLSGKTSLLESILYATGAIGRRGSTRAGTSIGDGAAESRKRGMGTEINVATVDYLGDQWTFLKFAAEDLRALYGIEALELNVWKPVVDHVAEQIDQLQAGVTQDLENSIATVNALAQTVARLNQQIASAKASGHEPNDLGACGTRLRSCSSRRP